jgi:hypothetical protein
LGPRSLWGLLGQFHVFQAPAGGVGLHFKDIWVAKLPLKIKIFTWQIALNRLPTRSLIADRHGLGLGGWALCGAREDVHHICFDCSLARFMWSVVRQLLGCSWSLANFAQLYAIIANLLGRVRRLVWALFVAQSWALWHIRNKLSIESKIIRHPSDVIYKTLVFLQLWVPTAKAKDQASLRWLICELRRIHASSAPND